MANEDHFEALKLLLNASNRILGSFISKNKFESEETKLYTIIKDNKETIDKGLFLIPTHSINELKRNPAFDESKTENYLHQIEMINLAIFAYNVYKGEEYETCINNFFTSITNEEDKPTTAEIEFYIKLRHIALAAYCKENKNTDRSKAIKLFFPEEPEKLYFSNEVNYDVIVSLNDYRQNLSTQSMGEIINIPTLFNDNASLLRDFVANRYQKLELKLRITLKRKNEEESSAKKKVKTSNTLIATPEVGESEKAKAARLINKGPKGRRLTEQETFPEISLSDIMDSEDENPRESNESDPSEEEDEEERQQEEGDKLTDANDDDKSESFAPSSSPENSCDSSELFSAPSDSSLIVKKKIRKQNKPWTKEEVLALENGLRKFRRPYWSCIIEYAEPVLNERTGVNVKDKARNMIRELERRGCTEPDQFGPYKFVKNPDNSSRYNLVRK